MQDKLKTELNSIVNLPCCKAEITYGGVLAIGLGELVEYDHPKLKNIYHGQWEIRTNSASWRILKDKEIIVGDYDADPLIKSSLDSLVRTKLIGIRLQSIISDVKLEFDNNIVLEIIGTSKKDYSWVVVGPTFNIEARPDEQLVKLESDFVESLDPDEKNLSVHSEACYKRWESAIPEKTKDNNCRHCFYYRALSQGFYFSDYGLCANSESVYDGKVVNVGSGCEKYDIEFKNT